MKEGSYFLNIEKEGYYPINQSFVVGENQDLNKSIYDSKQQTQPHISCITGYNLLISAVPVILAPNSNPSWSLTL